MPPVSSLIFVVILAVWAVYLVQHWVRRRDHLATARSVDRFSESMRVLERRRALPRPDLSEPTPRSYSVSPLRPARPEVTVKRVPAGATAVQAPPAVRTARIVARLRAGGLLLGSVAMVTLVTLSLTKHLPPWAALVGVVVMAASVAGVRLSTARARRATAPRATKATRATTRPARQTTPSRTAGPARTRTAAPARATATEAARTAVTEPARTPAADRGHALADQSVAATTRTARRSVSAATLYDIDRVEADLAPAPAAPTRESAPAEVVGSVPAQAAEGTWQPVPVPPPTYTLKARAYRPQSSGQLPADGTQMALEEEFEELPRIESVG